MICDKFWTDSKVKQLKPLDKLTFLYLITNPHTHLCGLYYLPEETAAAELGIKVQWEPLLSMVEYDREFQHVWVRKMYPYQGRGPKAKRATENQLLALHCSPLVQKFAIAYGFAKLLENTGDQDRASIAYRYPPNPNPNPNPNPYPESSTPDLILSSPFPDLNSSLEVRKNKDKKESKSSATFEAFAEAYRRRYGIAPVRNAAVNAQLCRLVDHLGSEAPAVAAFYVTANDRLYITKRHPVNLLLNDATGLRTQWATGVRATPSEVRHAEMRDDAIEQIKRVRTQMRKGE
jgi:hypothetical protein